MPSNTGVVTNFGVVPVQTLLWTARRIRELPVPVLLRRMTDTTAASAIAYRRDYTKLYLDPVLHSFQCFLSSQLRVFASELTAF